MLLESDRYFIGPAAFASRADGEVALHISHRGDLGAGQPAIPLMKRI